MTMTQERPWRPQVQEGPAPLYRRLVETLQRDIAGGVLRPGDRLPPQRELAYALGLGIGTVTRAYADAEQRGLIEAHVGRGSFVAQAPRKAGASATDGPIDLARNVAPVFPAEKRLAETLARLRRRPDLLDHLGYPPPLGFERERRAAAAWLERTAAVGPADWRRLALCDGGQQGMSLALAALTRPGEHILAEAASFMGIKAAAEAAGLALEGLAMDAEGLTPEALDKAAAAGPRLVYLIPTLQNPTARTMGEARRREIVRIARARDLWILEDDVYAPFAMGAQPPCFAALAPERTFYVSALSKAVAPGLRMGFLMVPDESFLEPLVSIVRARSYAPAAFGHLIGSSWIEEGLADDIAREVREEVRVRTALARSILGDRLGPGIGDCTPHLWLPMSELEAERASARAARAGVEVTPPSAPIIAPGLASGLRVCVGGTPDREGLELGLRRTAEALNHGGRAGADLV